jgi:hypothetical protein
MLLHQFHRLAEGQSYRHLIANGVCIADRYTETEDRVLFQLPGYYVEVVFRHQSDHIVSVNCFRGTNALAPYLEEMNIEALLHQ